MPTVTKDPETEKMLPYGINNLSRKTQTELKTIQGAQVPKKKRPKTSKPKKKKEEDSDNDSELYGFRIEENKTCLVSAIPIKKGEYRVWRPYLREAKLPPWAERVMDQPTYVQLSDKNKPSMPKSKRVSVIDQDRTVDVENVSIDYSKWVVHDGI